MKASIRRLHSPDVTDLVGYRPTDSDGFGFLLQVMIGPEGGEGEESFDVTVCSPNWLLARHNKEDVVIGRHHLIMFEYDYLRLKRTIEEFCKSCEGATWKELALKLGRLGKWEFEDYVEPS